VRLPFQNHLMLLLAVGLIFHLVNPAAPAQAQESGPRLVEDDEVPPGVAAGWIVGNRLLAEGNSADALPYLHQAYRAHPNVVVIAMDFQEALASEGYLRDAIKVMDGLVAAYPDSQSFRMRRSTLNLSAGRRDEALDDLREIRRRGDASVDVLAAEASILAAEGKTNQALDVLRDGLHLHPARGRDIFLEMARILRQGERLEEVPDLMDEALVTYPDDPTLWLVKIRSLAALGNHDLALAVATEADAHFADLTTRTESGPVAVPIDPDVVPQDSYHSALPTDSFSVELADYYAQINQIDLALGILRPLAEKDELGLSPSLWLARLLLGTGRQLEGTELVEEINAKWPNAGRGWFLRGKIEEGQGAWEASVPFFRQAVELEPYDPEIRLGLVRAMLVSWEVDLRGSAPDSAARAKIEEFEVHCMTAATLVNENDTQGQMLLGYGFRALGDLDRATWRFKLAAENPELRLQALIQKSICHDENGEEAQARFDLELLRREFPDDPEVANSLGYFLAEKGTDLDLAEGLIREALAVEPGNGAYLDSLGWVMYRNGRLEEAFDYLIQAVNVLPDDPVILEHLGMVLAGLGQDTEAVEVLRRSLARGGDADRIGALIEELENPGNGKE
jgi:tetratricopeptide (TPR) repeat protein